MSKPFFFRITAADLINFATDPEGENMSLLRFAKELQKGESDIEFIQSVIDEASNYIEKKRISGAKGGKAKASGAIALLGDAQANSSTPLARSRSISSSSNRSNTEYNKEEETPSQRRLRQVLFSKKPNVLTLLPHVSSVYEIEAEQMIAHYKSKNIGVDPYAKVLNWFKRVQKPEEFKLEMGEDTPSGRFKEDDL